MNTDTRNKRRVNYFVVESSNGKLRHEIPQSDAPDYAEDNRAKDRFANFLFRLSGEPGTRFNLVREHEDFQGVKVHEVIMTLVKNDGTYKPWEISGPHSATQAANQNYCGTCNEYLPLDSIVEHWLVFQPSNRPEPITSLRAIKDRSGNTIPGTALCDKHYADHGRRNYSEQVASDHDTFLLLERIEVDGNSCSESDEDAARCGNL